MCRLALTGDATLVLVMDRDGARWHWQPEEPAFIATRTGLFGSDVDQPGAEERRLLAEHGIAESDFTRLQLLDVAEGDLKRTNGDVDPRGRAGHHQPL